jgi:threonine dehydratase
MTLKGFAALLSSRVPIMADSAFITVDAIRDAAGLLRGAVRVTPVLPASSDEAWAHVRLKCENLQVVGSFKARGALTMMTRLGPQALQSGVITYSSGNHGQAVAWAARRLGARCTVVMPTTAPAVKIDGARRLGAHIVLAGTTTLDRKAKAERLQRDSGLTMIPPFDHPDIIAGQGTIALEIVDQVPGATAIYVPTGGGGLISGVAVAAKALRPGVCVIGAEPEGAPKMTRSLAAGRPVTLDRVNSIADGLLAVRPGDLPFAHVSSSLVDRIVTVSDAEITETVRWLALDAKLVVEPSGAVSVAACRRLAPPGTPGVHVAIISGGNVAPEQLAALLDERPGRAS